MSDILGKEQPIVRLEHVSKSYLQGKVKVHAVNDVSLDIQKGDFTALCGPSGSGKTSLLNLIGGLDVPDAGSVWVDGVDLASLSRTELAEVRKNRIGFVFQAYNLIPVMTAYENAAFVLDLQDVAEAEKHHFVMQVLKDVGLEGLEQRRPDEMSGGQQQRVAIARAIVTHPAIVLADEPTANVDSETAKSLLQMMADLNEKQGITFLFSTHDQQVMDKARRIIQVHDGKIASDTTA
ncbi:ABC transporter ATP-binding protein [Ghiorsea bivora]|uniref:ABC transporter ATP-binding protein n=1 Tax=Ghiorsea bivora TaxID=1485545 RepID=UPI00056F4EF4|nr:ABC transporter ATP-binding protein [Ghiorsea bivora]